MEHKLRTIILADLGFISTHTFFSYVATFALIKLNTNIFDFQNQFP